MSRTNTYQLTWQLAAKAKLRDYAQLTKMRLSSLVVFSAVMAYVFVLEGSIQWMNVILLGLAGWMVTAASNTINQVIEKKEDRLMDRTNDRPLATKRMSTYEAVLLAGVLGTAGIAILGFHFNPLSGLLGALALISYAFIYTPFKKISAAAVFVGAVPGAMPLLIGCTAATGELSLIAFTLFGIQFIWQMPHFWSIAWLMNHDYAKADYRLLPANGEKDRASAYHNIPYLLLLILAGATPFILGVSGIVSLIVISLAGLYFLKCGIQLVIDLSDKSAKKLMFASFIYIPVTLIALVADKI
ncbi:MAG: heme o synthase [Bacteroidetes bacterium]|nr:heme o synthase [Bacteroidota bacterium]